MYEKIIFEVAAFEDTIGWINDNSYKIVSSGFITESNQMYIIFEMEEIQETEEVPTDDKFLTLFKKSPSKFIEQ